MINSICYFLRKKIYKLTLRVIGRKIDVEYKIVKEHEQLSKKEIIDMQILNLRKILVYAGEHIPYYEKIFDEYQFKPKDFKKLSDLNQLPYLTKEIIKENVELFISDSCLDKRIERKTGGSTGNKLKIYYGSQSLDITAAIVLRCLTWTGKSFGSKEIHFSSNIHTHIPFLDKWKERIKCFVLRRENIVLDIFNEDVFFAVLMKIKKSKPYLIQGFPSIAYALACYAEKNNMQVRHWFSVYESTGETLYDFQRAKIEDVFGCKIFNRYGDAEFGVIAYECKRHNGMHVQSDIVYVETPFCEDLKSSNQCEIVVTTLTNTTMPLIRYRTGDLGTLQNNECSCGLPFPRIVNMQGRVHDFLEIEGLYQLSTTFLLDLFDKYGGANNFQVQKNLNQLDFFVLPDEDFSIDKLQNFRRELLQFIKNKIKVNIHLVETLKILPSGKFRYVIGDNIEYELSQQKRLCKDEYGEIDISLKIKNILIIADLACFNGFYPVEQQVDGKFVWAKCRGSFYAMKNVNSMELLSLSSESRILELYDANKLLSKIELLNGWHQYDVKIKMNTLVSFNLDKEISREDKNNDTRELGIGFRELFIENRG